jgi:hypothetical protein
MKNDVEKYIEQRKRADKPFAKDFEGGYEQFKIGVMLRQAREEAGGDAGKTGAHHQNEEVGDLAPGEPRRECAAVHRSACSAGIGQGGACRTGGGELGSPRGAASKFGPSISSGVFLAFHSSAIMRGSW